MLINIFAYRNKVVYKVLSKKRIIVLLGTIVYINITYILLLSSRNYIIDACFTSIYNILIDYNNYIIYTNITNKP
jgi:hypothetical protein